MEVGCCMMVWDERRSMDNSTKSHVTSNYVTDSHSRIQLIVRGTPSASDAHSSSASASDSRLPSASAPATSSLFRNTFGRMTSYATRSRPASAPDRMVSRDVA